MFFPDLFAGIGRLSAVRHAVGAYLPATFTVPVGYIDFNPLRRAGEMGGEEKRGEERSGELL